MSVPHIDSRMINGETLLLFGPAGFSTRFLKKWLLFRFAFINKTDNIFPMISAGVKNIPLTKYLIDQVRQSPEDRINALREYVPGAKSQDWVIEESENKRVQVIKKIRRLEYWNLVLKYYR
jgi:malate dehydrogenase (quinone)